MTHNLDYVEDSIERAADRIGSVWPVHSFVAANPLAGLEDRPFHRAVAEARELFGGRGYPHPSVFRQAWDDGRIDPDVLAGECAAHGIDRDPEALLDEMAEAESARQRESDPATDALDRILTKWLAAFLDRGQAEWSMPDRERGFYAAWRELAPYDDEIPGCRRPSDLPESSMDALDSVLSGFPEGRWETIFERHLASLPGWTGFVKQQQRGGADAWQTAAPITLVDYLAVRLTLADLLDVPIDPADAVGSDAVDPKDAADSDAVDSDAAVNPGVDEADGDEVPVEEVWLTAWEKSYRSRLLETVERPDSGSAATPSTDSAAEESRPAAQLVFCIDTRSEVIRRHIEAAGPYETAGYAGFFGVPMRYRPYDSDVEIDACPPIVEPQHRVLDRPEPEVGADHTGHDRWTDLTAAARKHLKTLKTNAAAAFPFVEGAGGAYGAAMAARTLFPARVHDVADAVRDRIPSPHAFCTPTVDPPAEDDSHAAARGDGELERGMSLEEKAEYAQTAFELMEWTEVARLVVFTGHASETANNPFESSLDCGACAGNPGGPNARVLATICNDEAVQSVLRARGFDVPSDTVFVAAEHNTTTDEITLFDGTVPESHRPDLERLRDDLAEARAGAAAERAESFPVDAADPVRETERRATDWAETRPEWGLAGNASFVIGPRELTAGRDLDGRAFLHSYDWETDPEGEALEAIMTGPLVVTQWINNQYYFATVDNAVYGGGSKTTQNPVGNVGVVQGNGGDLMTGLPRQSVSVDHRQVHHQPIRLTVLIHAPVGTVTDLLRDNERIAELFDNGWMQLTVMDPEREDTFHYQGDLEWDSKLKRVRVQS